MIRTVADLIAELEKVEDKQAVVMIDRELDSALYLKSIDVYPSGITLIPDYVEY